MGVIIDISYFYKRRDKRLDSRDKPPAKKRTNFDFEVGVYPPDEGGDKGKKSGTSSGGHGNTRLPYGLCKAAGIDTEGMTPKDAWDALAGKTGVKAKDAYKKLEKEGSEGLEEVKKAVKSPDYIKEHDEEMEEPPDKTEAKKTAADKFKAAVEMSDDRERVKELLEQVKTGGIVHYTPIDKHGSVIDKDATATRNADGTWTLDIGKVVDTELLSYWVNRDRKRKKPFSLEADDYTVPTTGKTISPPPAKKTPTPPAPVPPGALVIPAAPVITGTKIPVKTTGEVDIMKLATVKNAAKKRDEWAEKHSKYDAIADTCANAMKYLFDNNEFCINFAPGILEGILRKGFLNQMQTAKDPSIKSKTHGAYSPSLRKQASRNMFGTPTTASDDDYEKYGYLGNPLDPEVEKYDIASHYGSVTAIMRKDRVKNRVTYSLRDSLGLGHDGNAVPGRDGDDPTYHGAGFLPFGGGSLVEIINSPTTKKNIGELSGYEYIELQYHGELTMSDVDTLVFRSASAYSKVTPDVKQALDALGVKIVKLYKE